MFPPAKVLNLQPLFISVPVLGDVTMVEQWETLSSRTVADCRIFTVDMIQRKRPSQQVVGEFALIRSHDWVNIIPITDRGTVVMIRQFRHGTSSITLEVPGGIVEPSEEPLHAAMRECTEETGFSGMGTAELVGVNEPNPAIQNNRCYSYVWHGCSRSSVQALDEHEDIEVVEVPLGDIRALVRDGTIRHSLVLTALFFYFVDTV